MDRDCMLPKDYEPFDMKHRYMQRLRLISKVLKSYVLNGKTPEEFAEEYGCDIIRDSGHQIQDIKFHNDSNETMFMLKYNNAT